MDTTSPLPDPHICEQARLSRDARFDGLFFTAVSSTSIYCRPVCPAPAPKRANVRYYANAAAAEAAGGFVLTGRAENQIRGNPDLDDTITRLQAYERAGADVLYAPGLTTWEEIRTVCEAVSKPVNVLARANLTFDEMAEAGAQRISVGGALTWVAVAGLVSAAERIRDSGDFSALAGGVKIDQWL